MIALVALQTADRQQHRIALVQAKTRPQFTPDGGINRAERLGNINRRRNHDDAPLVYAEQIGQIVGGAGIGRNGAIRLTMRPRILRSKWCVGQPFAPIRAFVFFHPVRIRNKWCAAQRRILPPRQRPTQRAQSLRMHDIYHAAPHPWRNRSRFQPAIQRIIDLPPDDAVWAQRGRRAIIAQRVQADALVVQQPLDGITGSRRGRRHILYPQFHVHAQIAQVCDQVKYMPLDAAVAVQWIHRPRQHCHRYWMRLIHKAKSSK